jgi:anti-sigma regulatory factor (Ser/Thr protein kinase)
MIFRVSLLVKCQMKYRDPVGELIRYVCNRLEEQGEPETFGHQVISAYNEAFNNLVRHGGKDVEQKEVLVSVSVTDSQLVIEMEDDADGFYPPKRVPKMNGVRESGMGLIIMQEFMDTINYRKRTKNGVNSMTMARNLSIRPKYV